MAGSAAAPAPRRRNCRRGSFISDLPLWSLYSITSSARHLMGLCVVAARQAHGKHRPFAGLARRGPAPAHQARELAGDRKAKPRPAVPARGQGIGLGEILKQFRLLLRRHTDAAIRDRKLDPVASVRRLAHAQRDLALLRELAGIAEEIEQDLLEPHGVRVQRANVLLGFDVEAVLFFLFEPP